MITALVEPGMRYWQPSVMRGDMSLRMSSCCSSKALDFGILKNSDFSMLCFNVFAVVTFVCISSI